MNYSSPTPISLTANTQRQAVEYGGEKQMQKHLRMSKTLSNRGGNSDVVRKEQRKLQRGGFSVA